MIKYGNKCTPTLIGVRGNKSRFKTYKSGIVNRITSIMANWAGTQDTYIPVVLNCGTSTIKNVNKQYTEVFEITKDAHQSQTIRKLSYTHFQLTATSTTGWVNKLKIHVYTSTATNGHAILTFDYCNWRYIYENMAGISLQTAYRSFNMQHLI